MIVGKAIYHLLTNATAITDIVGTRIYPEVAQQDGDLPYIVYNITNNEPSDTKPEPSKLDTAGVEVNCYATSYSQAIDIAVAVRGALDRVRGTYNGVNVQSIQYINEIIDFDEPQRAYNISADYEVRISRTDFEIAQGSPVTGTQLGQLSDVNVSSLAEGQILKYDESEEEWVNASLPILTTGSLTQSESSGYTILSISSNPTFESILSSGNVTVSGDIFLAGASTKLIRPLDVGQAAGPLTIQSNGDLVIELDQDNNEPYKAFIVKNGGDAEVFKVDEEGNVTVNQEYILPTTDGSANYFLKTDGNGQLYFATLYGTSGDTGASPPPAIDTLVELLDTDISNLQDNQIIRYDSASGKWLNEDFQALPAGGTTGQALVKASGTDYDVQWADIAIDVQYHQRYDTEAGTLRSGATETVELYYTAQADGDGLSESASSDTPTSGYDIRRKLWYAEKAQADPDTSADWTQFTAIADNTTFNNAKAALLAYLKERTGGTVPISLKMTWEEVAQAPAFTGLLNESYGSGAEAAYSTRRLNGNVTDCMVIRRASDSTTQTIGFDGSGNIDESAITTFCTGTTCTVVTWKDQSGNGNDATAAAPANEPTIYTGGALVKEGGKVALDFNGTSNYLTFSDFDFDSGVSAFNIYALNSSPTTSDFWHSYFVKNTAGNNVFGLEFSGNTSYDTKGAIIGNKAVPNDTVIVNTNQHLNTNIYDGAGTAATDVFMWEDGQSLSFAANQGWNAIGGNSAIGWWTNGGATQHYDGKHQELIFYTSDKSSVRTSIESNIGDYFTQNTPLLDTYSGAAAAYSLRLLDSTYTGSAVEVYNGSSYADIGFNVFGELDTVALAAHCGSNDGFVSKWYDQSGNTNTAAQTTTANMPKIYDGTTGVVTENGKPAVEFIRTSATKLTFTTGLSSQTNLIAVAKNTDTTWGTLIGESYAGGVRCLSSALWDSNTNVDDFHHNGSLFLDGVELSTGTAASNVQRLIFANAASGGYADTLVNIGQGYTGREWSGPVQEIIFYASDQSSNRTNIEDNINTFYNIY